MSPRRQPTRVRSIAERDTLGRLELFFPRTMLPFVCEQRIRPRAVALAPHPTHTTGLPKITHFTCKCGVCVYWCHLLSRLHRAFQSDTPCLAFALSVLRFCAYAISNPGQSRVHDRELKQPCPARKRLPNEVPPARKSDCLSLYCLIPHPRGHCTRVTNGTQDRWGGRRTLIVGFTMIPILSTFRASCLLVQIASAMFFFGHVAEIYCRSPRVPLLGNETYRHQQDEEQDAILAMVGVAV